MNIFRLYLAGIFIATGSFVYGMELSQENSILKKEVSTYICDYNAYANKLETICAQFENADTELKVNILRFNEISVKSDIAQLTESFKRKLSLNHHSVVPLPRGHTVDSYISLLIKWNTQEKK